MNSLVLALLCLPSLSQVIEVGFVFPVNDAQWTNSGKYAIFQRLRVLSAFLIVSWHPRVLTTSPGSTSQVHPNSPTSNHCTKALAYFSWPRACYLQMGQSWLGLIWRRTLRQGPGSSYEGSSVKSPQNRSQIPYSLGLKSAMSDKHVTYHVCD